MIFQSQLNILHNSQACLCIHTQESFFSQRLLAQYNTDLFITTELLIPIGQKLMLDVKLSVRKQGFRDRGLCESSLCYLDVVVFFVQSKYKGQIVREQRFTAVLALYVTPLVMYCKWSSLAFRNIKYTYKEKGTTSFQSNKTWLVLASCCSVRGIKHLLETNLFQGGNSNSHTTPTLLCFIMS